MKPLLIGKGAFTKAYLFKNKVLLKSCDPVKECMANKWFPSSRLFPKVSRTAIEGFDYEMKYYPATAGLKAHLKPTHWELYQNLRNLDYQWWPKESVYTRWLNAFSGIKNTRYRAALVDALDACAAYGEDVCFEISPRNVRAHNGNLILLDCFYHQSTLNKLY